MPPGTDANGEKSALSGLRILDLTGRRGGYCGRLLANLGAEVVLIEPPDGAPARHEGPFKDGDPHPEKSLAFAACHTNKRSVVVDLEREDGRRTFRGLVRHADVVIEDRGLAWLERLGLGIEELRSINPALVLTSITGFGLSGPYRDFEAPGIVAFAMGGLMSVCGHPERPPLMGPSEIAFFLGSVHAAFGTLVALYNRRATGLGELVEVSLQDVLAGDPFLRLATRYSATGEIVGRTGHRQPTTVADTYRCRDGYVRIFCNQADHWRRLVEWLGNPPELADPKYDDVQNRFPLRSLLDRMIESRTADFTVDGLFEELQSRRLAAAPVHSPRAFLEDKQTKHRGYVVELNHPHLGRHGFPGDPYRFSESPCRIERPAPILGEHQAEIDKHLARPSAWLAAAGRDSDARPFAGVRVLSFPTGIVGPALAGLLAEHGAEVIAIEPGRAARSPQRGPVFQLASDLEGNRNRKRIALDMKHPEGAALARRLIERCDVVVENFSARVLASWGLDYPRMKEIRRDVILASLQAFGHTGPRRDFLSFGPILMAFSGMTYLWRDPEVERPGAASQTAFPDYLAPSFGALAILAALHYRARTGKGQHIDISQAETAASMLAPAYLEWLIGGREPEPRGNASALAAPHGCYRCRGEDRWCVISIETDEQWARFCGIAGEPQWESDPRFSCVAARLANRKELDALVESWTIRHTPHQVMIKLQRAGIAAGVVQSGEDLYRDPHLRERGFTREVYHPETGWITRTGPTVRLHGVQARREEFAHRAGEDNEAVLGGILGLSREQIADLTAREVLR
ncbi:MAG TPA: CoA transferase [candidate division Zixibacteria bacterium]|nr:CoA transferase [candidate division Zixibacteria bacterium]